MGVRSICSDFEVFGGIVGNVNVGSFMSHIFEVSGHIGDDMY